MWTWGEPSAGALVSVTDYPRPPKTSLGFENQNQDKDHTHPYGFGLALKARSYENDVHAEFNS
jgi:hypothetical protein